MSVVWIDEALWTVVPSLIFVHRACCAPAINLDNNMREVIERRKWSRAMMAVIEIQFVQIHVRAWSSLDITDNG